MEIRNLLKEDNTDIEERLRDMHSLILTSTTRLSYELCSCKFDFNTMKSVLDSVSSTLDLIAEHPEAFHEVPESEAH